MPQIKKEHIVILTGIAVFGTVMFLAGANWGLPVGLHPDECTIVEPILEMIQNKTFEPPVFYHPDHLLIQINLIVYKGLAFVLRTTVQELEITAPEVFYLAARIVTGLFAIGCVGAGYCIGRRYHARAGLTSAFLFACFPAYVTHAHYVTPDIPTTFFMLLFILFALDYMENPSHRNLLFISLVTSCFIATKYPGAILCVCITLCVTVRAVKNHQYSLILKHGALAAIFVLGGLFLISPVLFTNFEAVLSTLTTEARSVHIGADGRGFAGNLLYYGTTYLEASGLLLAVAFGIGCFYLMKEGKLFYKWIPLLSGMVYCLFLSCVPLHWERWALPMYVSPLLIAAIGASCVPSALAVLIKNAKLCSAVCVAFGALTATNLVSGSAASLVSFLMPDTRVISMAYCEEMGINHDNTLYEGYTPLSPPHPLLIIDAFSKNGENFYPQDTDIDYIVLSSWIYERFLAQPERSRTAVSCYQWIMNNYRLIRAYPTVSAAHSPIDIVNIYNNLS